MHVELWIRWYMIVFFTLFGVWFLMKRTTCAKAGAFISGVCDGTPWADRLAAVVRRREQLEDLHSQTMAYVLGGCSLLLAVLAAFTPLAVTLLYALLCVVLALTIATEYERLRRVAGPRAASLRMRDPGAVAPWYVYALTAAAVVSPLTYIPVAPVAAVLVTIAGLLMGGVALGVVKSPAVIPGNDVSVEQYVDDRLRAIRAVNLLGTSAAPAFVFASFTGYTDSALHVAVEIVTFAAFMVCLGLQIAWMRRRPGAVEIERWSQSGA